ncbi:hypothetical protein EVAR_42662_1 [Eumeta japonica]|uniref:Uncharacterized protein n=1 Tax=Eumeta variegata TaxID=151549 RepID=A0A4C1YK94_EUMVA|nr:hypothetical protein EVAR_42662_1 [Eumeta japonica]
MGPTRVGVPLTSCAEEILLRQITRPQHPRVSSSRISPTLFACTGARVCVTRFLSPRRKKKKKEKKLLEYISSMGSIA